ncbi:MAG TPA: histidine--tRNA ligase, partial [Clostridiales bacterium UBA8960]|nr:histidine--tRNA ligase [Clostridiales bacterium UBA8960]
MYTTLPPTGMRDFLPREKEVREFVMRQIREEYKKSGFTEIETSFIENIGNLTGGDGGENTKLIFKIMMRGDKLKASDMNNLESLADLGLRFDLTLPLVRFYANNRNALPTIFKALQMGTVFRAERPQKGRYRAFTQCDIDIIGDESNLAEVEIIQTIASTLKKLD